MTRRPRAALEKTGVYATQFNIYCLDGLRGVARPCHCLCIIWIGPTI